MHIPHNNNELILNLKNILENYGFDFEIFSSLLKKHMLVLSGSFLLQAITDKYYNYSDINLYMFGERNLKTEKDIIKMIDSDENNVEFFNISKNENIKKNNLLNANNDKEHISFTNLGINSKSILNFMNDNNGTTNFVHRLINNYGELTKIEINYIDNVINNDINEFMNKFDIDICSNYYDGINIYIKNYERISKKIMKFRNENNTYFLTNRNIDRILKYYRRTFLVILNNEYDDTYFNFILNDKNKSLNKYFNLAIYLTGNNKLNYDTFNIDLQNLLIYDNTNDDSIRKKYLKICL